MLPRLVTGALWFTDGFLGLLDVAGLVPSSAVATPLHRVIVDVVDRLIKKTRALGSVRFKGRARGQKDLP